MRLLQNHAHCVYDRHLHGYECLYYMLCILTCTFTYMLATPSQKLIIINAEKPLLACVQYQTMSPMTIIVINV